jgi:hypothetical protein
MFFPLLLLLVGWSTREVLAVEPESWNVNHVPSQSFRVDAILASNDALATLTVTSRDGACELIAYALSVRVRTAMTDNIGVVRNRLSTRFATRTNCAFSACQQVCKFGALYGPSEDDSVRATVDLFTNDVPCAYADTPGVATCTFSLCVACVLTPAYVPTQLCYWQPFRCSMVGCTESTCPAVPNQDWSEVAATHSAAFVGHPDSYTCTEYKDANGYVTQASYAPSTLSASRPCRVNRCPPGYIVRDDTCMYDTLSQCLQYGARSTDYAWFPQTSALDALLCNTHAPICEKLGYWSGATVSAYFPYGVTSTPTPSSYATPYVYTSPILWRCVCMRAAEPYSFILVDQWCATCTRMPTVDELHTYVIGYDALSLPQRLSVHTTNPCTEPPIRTQQPVGTSQFPAPNEAPVSGSGTCQIVSGAAKGCTCVDPLLPDYKTYDANPTDPLLASPYCTVSPCVDWHGDAANTCYGRGTCVTSARMCTCTAGWYGRACEWPVTQTLVCGTQTVTLTTASTPVGNVVPEDTLYQLAASTLTVNARVSLVETWSTYGIEYRLMALASPYALWVGLTLVAQRALQLDHAAVCGALAAAAGSSVCTLPFQVLPTIGNAYTLCSPPATVWRADFEAQTIWCMAVSPLVPTVHAAGDTFCWSNYNMYLAQPVACQFFDTYRLAELLSSPQHDMYKWSALHAVLDDVAC